MMNLESSSGATAGHAATAAVATPHETHDARRDVLVRALWRGAIERSNVLGIAFGALDGGGPDRDLRACAVLPALAAALAHRHRDLVLRTASRLGGCGAIEHRVAQRGDELVVGQVAAECWLF